MEIDDLLFEKYKFYFSILVLFLCFVCKCLSFFFHFYFANILKKLIISVCLFDFLFVVFFFFTLENYCLDHPYFEEFRMEISETH